MDIENLQRFVVDALEDVKAQDIQLFDTTEITSLFDRIVIATGSSNRQTRALASSVREKVKENGGNVVSMEGEKTGEWVLVDLGDMVVHVMQAPIRAYYRLEEIWGDHPIDLATVKVAPKKRAPRKTASTAKKTETKPRAPRKKAAEGEAAPKKPAAKRAPAKAKAAE